MNFLEEIEEMQNNRNNIENIVINDILKYFEEKMNSEKFKRAGRDGCKRPVCGCYRHKPRGSACP